MWSDCGVNTSALASFLVEWPTFLLLIISYPLVVAAMAVVLRAVGVSRRDIARWALRQAGRQRLGDLIRALRGLPPGDPPAVG
jgi:hypothetical protein